MRDCTETIDCAVNIEEPIVVDDTQIHAWISPDGQFEMHIKAKSRNDLQKIIEYLSDIVERY